MKTKEILENETSNQAIRRPATLNRVKRSLAASIIAVCATLSAQAQLVYSVNIVGCVPDMTIYLLNAPMTTPERQALQAQNFKQLAPSLRPLYLHAVAYCVAFGVASDGKLPTTEMLGEHLQSIVIRGESAIYTAPGIPAEDSQLVGAEMFFVNAALQELNAGIAGQIANSPVLQLAMYAGAVDSLTTFLRIFDEIEDFEQ